MSPEIPSIYDDASQAFRTHCVAFASFTILIWDHIVTFPDEVEHIWNREKNLLAYLFLLNRYLTPLGFVINLFAYLSPVWTPERQGCANYLDYRLLSYRTSRCQHFIRYEGSMTMIGVEVVALMMLIRVYALYQKHKWVVGVVACILIVQTAVTAYLLTRGEAVVHNPASGIRACTMIFDPAISVLASSSAWLPLLYDTVVVGLVLYRTIPSIRHQHASYIMFRILEDGLLYYTVIFAITLILTLMIISAPPGLKNITAQLELLLTVAMMSRITLQLKKSVNKAYGDGNRPIIFRNRRDTMCLPVAYDMSASPSPVDGPNSNVFVLSVH